MREDMTLFSIKGEITPFPSFTYSWFSRAVIGISGSQLTKLLFLADEDRWGLYYGIKMLTRENDPEALVFWALLDETFNEDGSQFIIHCISIVLSVGGSKLQNQFGAALTQGANINVKPKDEDRIPSNIWLDIKVAKEAVKIILVRALASHIAEAMDAIDALKVRPERKELEALSYDDEDDLSQCVDDAVREISIESKGEKSDKSISKRADTPTHINFFMWLRLMLQQMHADQIHRSAAMRLMFETASVGALTPQIQPNGEVSGNNIKGSSGPGSHVEYPQFQSICQTLFPQLNISDIATLFACCHDNGRQKVTSEVFIRHASRKGYFSQAMKLTQLPLLAQHIHWKAAGEFKTVCLLL
jgi:hypothetical protein